MKVTLHLIVDSWAAEKNAELSTFSSGGTLNLMDLHAVVEIVKVSVKKDTITLTLKAPEGKDWRTGRPFCPTPKDVEKAGWKIVGYAYA